MTQPNGYHDVLHQLDQLRHNEDHDRATSKQAVDSNTTRVRQLRQRAEKHRMELIELSQKLNAAVPDLRPDPDVTASDTIDDALKRSRKSLDDVNRGTQSTLRAAALPPLLPRSHHMVRNFLVYGVAMVACFGVQVLLLQLTRAGVLPTSMELWIAFILPVLFLILGWIGTGFAGTPKLGVVDDKGKAVEFTVRKSPRLGVVLAIATMAGFWVWSVT